MLMPVIQRRPVPGEATPVVRPSSPVTMHSVDTALSSQNDGEGIPPPYTPSVRTYEPSVAESSVIEVDYDHKEPFPMENTTSGVSSLGTDVRAAAPHNGEEPPPYMVQVHCQYQCSLLPDHPAVWEVKQSNVKLSLVAAKVLLKEKLIQPEELECIVDITQTTPASPRDPITGVLGATFETVSNILIGLSSGPIEVYNQVQNSKALHQNPECPYNPQNDQKRNPIDQVAIEAGKGLGRTFTAALKAPVVITTALSHGFHNAPLIYGDEVRRIERVDGFKTGMVSAGKGFANGLVDGFTGFVMLPYHGARDGPSGFLKGFGKGTAGLALKPAAGACGLPAYALLGLWKEAEKLGKQKSEDPEPSPEVERESFFRHSIKKQEKAEVLMKWKELVGSRFA